MDNAFRNQFYLFDKPVPYKDLLIYPIKLREFFEFNFFASCFMLEKNSIKDNPELAIKAISMTYFEYMFAINNQENNIISLFDGLLRIILNKKEDKNFLIKYGKFRDGKPFFKIGKTLYESNDFEEIKKIISEQNMIDFPDMTIQKQVRDKMEEVRRYRNKVNKSTMPSLEEQLLALSLYSGWEVEKLYEITYRKFLMAIRRANHMIMSNIYLNASVSGFATFKDKSVLKGWIVDLNDEEKNKDVSIGIEKVQSNLGLVKK